MQFDKTDLIRKYTNWLKLEKSLSENSKEAYLHDLALLTDYLDSKGINPLDVKLENLIDFVIELGELGLSATSQGRVISGVKSFYKFLIYTDILNTDPTLMLETPKAARKLPEVLTLDEIERLEDSDDGMFYRARVRLFVDFASIDNVFVVGNNNREEQEVLENTID